MSLNVSDVQQVLAVAILDAKLASTDQSAAGFASTLAPALTQGLNLIQGVATGATPVQQEVDGYPLMTIGEAILVRNAVAALISEAEPTTDAAAEALLIHGYINVDTLIANVHAASGADEVPGTGQHTVSSSTGLVTTVAPTD